jgi:hypothetical protein
MLTDKLANLEGELFDCSVARFCGKLSEEEAQAVLKALDSHVPIRAIHRAIRSEGYRISRESLSTHRRRMCGCES